LEDVVSEAVEGGVNLVQLREKDLPAKQMLAFAERIREITRGRALLFINERVDIALACGADGVQLGEDGLPVEAARRIARDLLLGRSVHSVDGALKAQADGADILVVGTIFPSGSHPGVETAGVGLLEEMRGQIEIPYIAIGGVTVENVESVIEAGAVGAAGITAISKNPDPEQASRELLQRMRASSQKGKRA
jgi:thiamine-phosphate pyrophosphorylase